MPLTAWCDHVVHVDLVARHVDVASTCAQLLRETLGPAADVTHEAGRVQVRSDAGSPISSGAVLHALGLAEVRVYSLYERNEWSVA